MNYTTEEAGALLHLSKQSVYIYIKQGKLKAVKLAKRYLIPEEEIDRLLKQGLEASKEEVEEQKPASTSDNLQ